MMTFHYLGVLGVFALLAYVLGGLLRFQDRGNGFFRLFERLFWGALLAGSLYALFQTRGLTVYVVLFILLAIFVVTHQHVVQVCLPRFEKVRDFRPYGIFALLLGFSFFLQWNRISDFSGQIFAIHPDFLHYGRLAYFISETGMENSSFDVFGVVSRGPSMYHYLELWQTAFIARLFNLNMAVGFYLVVVPFYFALAVLGVLSWMQDLAGRFSFWLLALAPTLLFISTMGILDITRFTIEFYPTSPMDQNLYNYPKLILTFTGLVYLMNIDAVPGPFMGFVVSVAGLIFPSAIPALFTAYVVWCLWIGYTDQKGWKSMVKAVFFPFLTTLLFVGFYMLSSRFFEGVATSHSTKEVVAAFYTSRYGMVSVVYNIVFYFFSVLSTLSVYALVFGLILSKKSLASAVKRKTLFLVLVIGSGIVHFSVFLLLFNSWQLHQNTFVPAVALLVLMFSGVVLSGNYRAYQKILVVCILMVNVWYNVLGYDGSFRRGEVVDMEFYTSLQKYIDQESPNYYGFFRSYHDEMPTSSKHPGFAITGHTAAMFTNDFLPVCLSVFDIPVNKSVLFQHVEKGRVEKSIFYQYVARMKQEGDFTAIDAAVVEFVKEFNLRFLFFEDIDQIPAYFRQPDHTVLYNDREGFGVMVLKNQ